MKIHYYKSRERNLGDDLNEWMWRRLIPEKLLDREDDSCMLGIGTIIGMPVPQCSRKIVFSSGVGYGGNLPKIDDEDWSFSCVRGPLTAKILGLPEEASVTDGAILLNLFEEFKTPASLRAGVVFMPHISVANLVDWENLCAESGVTFLDPRGDHFETLKSIGRARLVLADAMHAAIVADALRVPWVALRSSSQISRFKWMDWALSLDVNYAPVDLPKLSFAHSLHNTKADFMEAQYLSQKQIGGSAERREVSGFRAYVEYKTRPKVRRAPSIIAKVAYTQIAEPILGQPLLAPLRKIGRSSKRVAAELLKELSTGRGAQLSAESIFSARLSEVRRRLDGLASSEMGRS